MTNRYTFAGAETGTWRVRSMMAVCGAGLGLVSHLDIAPAASYRADVPHGAGWLLSGVKSNVRYAKRSELVDLTAKQEPLGRLAARYAALILISKSSAWWALAQDERRAIFEDASHHTAIGLEYLPGIARQLYHCRDLDEPFDFLTWFEYAPEHEAEFNNLLARLRATIEWSYINREVDIRLERA